jgi:outer membrane protein assembly factor BamE
MEPRFFIALAAVLLTGCQAVPNMLPGPLKPYRMDIQQGNVVTQEMMAKVQPGMTRSQVRFALGTPLVTDVFHEDRWDYVYLLQKGGVVTEHRRIVVRFKGDQLASIEGDVVAADPAARAATPPEKKPAATPPVASPASPASPAPSAPPPGSPTGGPFSP